MAAPDSGPDIVLDRFSDLIGVLGKDVVGPVEDAVIDADALLSVELLDQLVDGGFGDEFIGVAVDHQAPAGAWGEEPEIVMAGRRGDADPTGDFGSAHEELHADEGAERVARNPEAAVAGIDGLHPVERGGGIGNFTNSAIVATLTAANAAKVEPHDGKAQALEALVHGEDDTVVHCSAVQRMRVEQESYGRTLLLGVVVASLQPTIRPSEHYFRHSVVPTFFPTVYYRWLHIFRGRRPELSLCFRELVATRGGNVPNVVSVRRFCQVIACRILTVPQPIHNSAEPWVVPIRLVVILSNPIPVRDSGWADG